MTKTVGGGSAGGSQLAALSLPATARGHFVDVRYIIVDRMKLALEDRHQSFIGDQMTSRSPMPGSDTVFRWLWPSPEEGKEHLVGA